MKSVRRTARTLLAIGAASLATQVAAKDVKPCLTRAEVAGLVQFVTPAVITSTRDTCTPHLAPTGFMAARSQTMIDAYAKGRAAHWPQARAAFAKFGADGNEQSAKVMNALPDSAFQSFVDVMIPTMLTSEIKPDSCRDIETMLEAIAPLAPEDMGRLVSAIFAVAVKPGKEQREPQICTE